MSLSQLIYTSTCIDAMTTQMAYDISCKSVSVAQQLGLTGRVFANHQQALAITEGPTQLCRDYFAAVSADSLVQIIILHVDREIEAREFEDYSVWLNLNEDFEFGGFVHELTPLSVYRALPANPSTSLKVMAEAYLTPDFLNKDGLAA